jgi:hypothetical protein
MKLPIFLLALTICVSPAARAEVIRVERNVPQLFVDDALIEQADGLRRTLHCPVKDDGGNQPVIAIENEFGSTPATLEANGTIVFDSRLKKYVMFALGFAPSRQIDRVNVFRFTSDDGLKWIKGDDGTPQRILLDLSDPAGGKPATNNDLFSCYYDARDAEQPYKGWAYLANFAQEGIWFFQSGDGKKWDRGPMVAREGVRTIEQGGRTLRGPQDVSIIYHDTVSDRLLAALKFTAKQLPNSNHLRSRAYLFLDRPDAPLPLDRLSDVAFVPPAEDRDGDLEFDEFYASTAWRYGSVWLGGLKVWHHWGDYPYSAGGCAFLKFAVSRDGLHWSKVRFPNNAGVPEVFIANGVEGGNHGRNDGGYLTEFSQGPIRIGTELIYYYGCSSWGKNQEDNQRITGGGIFRARLRVDGFVSVDAGTITTKMIEITGKRLLINSTGRIQVEALNASGASIASAQVEGDALAHPVAIELQGAARLRFGVQEGAHLYSFTVTD